MSHKIIDTYDAVSASYNNPNEAALKDHFIELIEELVPGKLTWQEKLDLAKFVILMMTTTGEQFSLSWHDKLTKPKTFSWRWWFGD